MDQKLRKYLGFLMILSSFIIYGYSFHNVDIAFNCQAHGFNFDTSTLGITRTCVEVFLLGMSGLTFALVFNFIGVCLWLYLLL